MKHPVSRLALFALTLAAIPFAAATETALVGVVSRTIPAGGKAAIGHPFVAARTLVGDTGTITAFGADYLDDANAKWTPAAFSAATAPHFVRITSGTYAGLTFRVAPTTNTATRVYLLSDATGKFPADFGITAGTTFEIIPGSTLATLFPAGTLAGGTSATTADTVSVWGGGSYLVFYFNTTRNRWERDIDTAASESRDTYVVPADAGLLVQNRGATDRTLRVMGRVADGDTPVRLRQPGSSFVAVNWPVDVTLGRLALQSPVTTNNWVGWNNPTTAASKADLVQVWSGTAWKSYYYDTARNQWQLVKDATNASADGVVIKAGSAIFVKRLQASATPAEGLLFIDKPAAN